MGVRIEAEAGEGISGTLAFLTRGLLNCYAICIS